MDTADLIAGQPWQLSCQVCFLDIFQLLKTNLRGICQIVGCGNAAVAIASWPTAAS